ncbi:hypothetical protein CR513_58227, partial [Mucuna pruriens]
MVLKKILPNAKDQRGKWAPNYEGPYVVKYTFHRDLKYPINVDSIKILTRATTKAQAPKWGKRKAREVRHQEYVINLQSLALGQETNLNHKIFLTDTPRGHTCKNDSYQ